MIQNSIQSEVSVLFVNMLISFNLPIRPHWKINVSLSLHCNAQTGHISLKKSDFVMDYYSVRIIHLDKTHPIINQYLTIVFKANLKMFPYP